MSNKHIAEEISIILIERYAYENTSESKTYSFANLSEEWKDRLINYLSSLDNINYTEKTTDYCVSIQFVSKIGDKITINLYKKPGVTARLFYVIQFYPYSSVFPMLLSTFPAKAHPLIRYSPADSSLHWQS